MIVVKVELHSANTGEVTNLGQMFICNDGSGDKKLRNYDVRVANKRDIDDFEKIKQKPQRTARVENHPSDRVSIWTLVKKALENSEY